MVLGKPNVAEPGSVCTQTWIVAGPMGSEGEAINAAHYLQTRFARFLVSLRKISQDAMRGVYRWVPQQDWTNEWSDQTLFHKYGLSNGEVEYIESVIKLMEAADDSLDRGTSS